MPAKKTKRKLVDWDSVHNLYKLGTLSYDSISEQYEADHINSQTFKKTVTKTAIIKQVKKEAWTKNLADKVKAKIQENLVTSVVSKKNLSDNDIINEAAEAGTRVIVRHKEEIKALLEHEERLLLELRAGATKVHVSNYQGEVTLTKLGLTVKEKSATLKDLAAVRAQRIALERQAHNINDDDVSSDKKRIRVGVMEIDD